jgi:hypothetical protein
MKSRRSERLNQIICDVEQKRRRGIVVAVCQKSHQALEQEQLFFVFFFCHLNRSFVYFLCPFQIITAQQQFLPQEQL